MSAATKQSAAAGELLELPEPDYLLRTSHSGSFPYYSRRTVLDLVRKAASQPRAVAEVTDELIERVLTSPVPGGSQVWWVVDGGGMAINNGHRAIARRVIEAWIAATTEDAS